MEDARSRGDPSPVPLHAALDLAALRTDRFRFAPPSGRGRAGRLPRAAILVAIAMAALMLLASSSTTLGATTYTPRCDAINLRTGPSTSYPRKTMVNEGARLTVVATVSGGHYSVKCAGAWRTGSGWHRISAINGRSVKSLYGVTYLYGARKLFRQLINPTPAPTKTPAAVPVTAPPTAAPSAASTAGPSAGPSAAPSTAPTTGPGATAVPSPTPAPTAAPTPWPGPTFVKGRINLPANVTFYGRGWGHGVGMSQYGAYGRALDGELAPAILAHYYQGTTLGTTTNKQVRVLVLQSFAASAANPVQIFGRGATWSIDGIARTFPADARLKFIPTTTNGATTWKVTVTAVDGAALYSGASSASIRVRPGTGTYLQLWSKPSAYDRYRGVLRIIGKTGSSATANVVNELPMETYLRGVVPAEVSASWPVAAVKAQAIAARSYAAYRLHPTTGTFDVYDTTRSQVYYGKGIEKAGSDAAIAATANVVLRTPGGGIANTLFHSTGGGATENNENVFVSETGKKVAGVFSYLRGSSDRRPDGSSFDAASAHATWRTDTYARADIQAWFAADSRTNVGTLVAIDLSNRGISGRLISVILIGANGTTKTVSGSVFREVFNDHRPSGSRQLRSTLFDLAPIP